MAPHSSPAIDKNSSDAQFPDQKLAEAHPTGNKSAADKDKQEIFTKLNDLRNDSESFQKAVWEFVDIYFGQNHLSDVRNGLAKRMRKWGVKEDQITAATSHMDARVREIWSRWVFRHPGEYISTAAKYREILDLIGKEFQKHHPNNPLPEEVVDGIRKITAVLDDDDTNHPPQTPKPTPKLLLPPLDERAYQLIDESPPPLAEPLEYTTPKRGCRGNDVFVKKTRRETLKRTTEAQSVARVGLEKRLATWSGETAMAQPDDSDSPPKLPRLDPPAQIKSVSAGSPVNRHKLDSKARSSIETIVWEDDSSASDADTSTFSQRRSGPTPIVDTIFGHTTYLGWANGPHVISMIMSNVRNRGPSVAFQAFTSQNDPSARGPHGLKKDLDLVYDYTRNGGRPITQVLEETLRPFVQANRAMFPDMPNSVFEVPARRRGSVSDAARTGTKRKAYDPTDLESDGRQMNW